MKTADKNLPGSSEAILQS